MRWRSNRPRGWSAAVAAALGMALSVTLTGAQGSTESHNPPTTRTYYVAADPVDWDYAPGGNQLGPKFHHHSQRWIATGPDRIGSTYRKSLYREYTDETFTELKPRPPEWDHLGILGPLLRGAVGDTIKVVFKNNTPFPASMHPHGVRYEKDSEGAPYPDGTSGDDKADDEVAPGDTHTYVWPIPRRAGPAYGDPSSVIWMYHSHVDEPADANAGLVGPIIVTRKWQARPDGSPADVDRELITMFSAKDENLSPWLEHNIENFAGDPDSVDPSDPEFRESNQMHGINGYVYGNTPGLTMQAGEKVRWYLIGLGNQEDLHTPHWHGQTAVWGGMRVDVMELLPASLKTVDMRPDNPGTWLYHCHVDHHIHAGMAATFGVAD